MSVQGVDIFHSIVRIVLLLVNGMFYFLLKPLIQGVFDLSSLTLSSNILNGVYSRVYVIVGIFMAFKLGISFFKYIIDPDSLTDGKDKGLGKILTNTIIMLAVLIMLPMLLFNTNGSESLITRAERALLPSIPRIILGSDVTVSPDSVDKAGDAMAVTIMRAFFAPSENLSDYCKDVKDYPMIESLDDVGKYIGLKCKANDRSGGYTEYYVYTYNIGSLAVGILLIIMFLGITINIAKRIFKLIILEILAPIPVMSLIDPKSASSGMFSKWLSSFISTFLDIFIQMGIVYLAVYFIQLISNNQLFSNQSSITGFRSTYITVALIIGVIYFAREAPKFIQDALGLKGSGSVGSIFGNALGMFGLGATALGAVQSGVNRARASFENDTANGRNHHFGNILKNAGAGLFGLTSGAAVGGASWVRGSFSGKGNDAGSVLKRQRDFTNAHIQKMSEKGNNLTSMMDTYLKTASDKARKDGGKFEVKGNYNGTDFELEHYSDWVTAYETAKAKGDAKFTLKDKSGNDIEFVTFSTETAKLDKALNGKAFEKLALDDSIEGKGMKDPELNALWKNIQRNGGKRLNRTDTKAISDELTRIKTAQINSKYRSKNKK